jgi:hypothetical protein
MGIVHSLHHLDAAAYARALAFVGTRSDIPLAEVRAFLAQLGRDEPARFEAESWDEVEEEVLSGDAARVRWVIVCAASARSSSTIDKAHDRPAGGFAELFARERSLAPVAELFRERDVPAECKGAEPLMQVAAVARVVRARDAMKAWLDDAARAKIAALEPGVLGRMFGPRDFAKAWRDDSCLWDNWRALGDVVTAAADAQEPLAVTWG